MSFTQASQGARLSVARHAPVDAENRCYGRTDVPVRVPHDRASARLVETFPRENAPPHMVWTSPVSRCCAVAEHLAAHFRATLRIDAALYEMNFGEWDGLTWPEIAARDAHAYAQWMREWEHLAPPGGEAPRELEARVRAWLTSLEPTQNHVLVAHAGVVRALYVVLEGRAWPDAMGIPVEHLAWASFRAHA